MPSFLKVVPSSSKEAITLALKEGATLGEDPSLNSLVVEVDKVYNLISNYIASTNPKGEVNPFKVVEALSPYLDTSKEGKFSLSKTKAYLSYFSRGNNYSPPKGAPKGRVVRKEGNTYFSLLSKEELKLELKESTSFSSILELTSYLSSSSFSPKEIAKIFLKEERALYLSLLEEIEGAKEALEALKREEAKEAKEAKEEAPKAPKKPSRGSKK